MVTIGFWVGVAILTLAVETGCCAVAYRIQRGARGLDIEFGELLLRSFYAGCSFTAAGWIGVFLCRQLDITAPGYLLASAVFLPVGAQVINWVFNLDDWPAGLGIYLLRAIPLLLFGVPLIALGVTAVH